MLAYILVCFLAYVLWKTLAASCEQAGQGHEPRRVLEELSQIRSIDVVLPTKEGDRNPQALHHQTDVPSSDPAAPLGPGLAEIAGTN